MSSIILRHDEPRITDVTQPFFDLLIHFECGGNLKKYLKAYLDGGGVPTIGIGTTVYPNGKRVRLGDTCTELQALQYCAHDTNYFKQQVDANLRDDINQGMFNGCVSFSYNTGRTKGTGLYKLINENPQNYTAIEAAWLEWKYDNHKVVDGLLRRRESEFFLYRNGYNHPTFFAR